MSKYINILKEKGLKITEQRIAVLKQLSEINQPILLNSLQDNLGDSINRITLYRILNDLEGGNLVRIFFGLDGQKYIEAKKENLKSGLNLQHLHFQCQKCDAVFCFDDIEITGLPSGFKIHSDKTVLAGLCETCEASPPAPLPREKGVDLP